MYIMYIENANQRQVRHEKQYFFTYKILLLLVLCLLLVCVFDIQNEAEVQKECAASIISKYRFLWLNLSELLQSLGNAYARTYSTYCIFIFVNIAIAVYGAFAEIVDHVEGYHMSYKEVGLIVDAVYCSTLLFIFCDCSHNATLGVANGVQEILLSIDLRQADKEAKNEIDLFIVAIEMNPAIVSLKGYVNVNRELLTSSIATITIYLLVLIQFKFSLDRARN